MNAFFATLTLALFTFVGVSSQDCPFTDEAVLVANVASVRHGWNPADQTVSIEMTYVGQGWLGFGFSSTGQMVGSTTVIGLPDEALSSTNPASYYLAEKSVTGVNLASPAQSLTDASVVQNGTHTVLTFTQPLSESGQLSVSTSASNLFIWAYGSSNSLGYHGNRGTSSLTLTACQASTTVPPSSNNSGSELQVGDSVCFEGFVMDEYCIQLGNLFDNPSVPTLVGPDVHSVHCLLDVPDCLASDWELLADPLSSDSNYTRAFVLDSDGKSKVIDIAKSVGVCDVCNGTVARGLRVQIRGSVTSLGSGDVPPTVQVADVQASSGSLNQAFCSGSTPSTTPQVGDEVCVEGYVMDDYCIQRGTLFDNPTVPTLQGADVHTVHCLVDVPECIASDWEIFYPPADGEVNYTRAFVLDENGKNLAVSVAKQVGSCGDCSGSLKSGLRIQARGFIHSLGSSGYPPVLNVTDLRGSNGGISDTFCKGGEAPAPAPTRNEAPPTSAPTDVVSQGNMFTLQGGLIRLRIDPNITGSNVFVEMTYAGQGWLAFGFSTDGRMVGSTSVIGLPGSGTNPELYFLSSTTVGGVNPLSSDKQTLKGASITQNATHTVLSFTKNFVDPGIVEISPASTNQFIYAYGSGNSLGYHGGRASVSVDLSNLAAGIEMNDGSMEKLRKFWTAHGVLMCVAWGILVPLAIGSSLLRSLLPFPEGTWFKIHFSLNTFAFACVIIGFALSVRAISIQNSMHFKQVDHRTIGLVIFLSTIVQVASGFFRPHLPHKAALLSNKSENGHDQPHHHNHFVEEVEELVKEVEEVAKSTARILWEYQHRILGVCLVGLSWYNCNEGLLLYAMRYGDDKTGAFWGVAGGLSGSILIAFVVSKLFMAKK